MPKIYMEKLNKERWKKEGDKVVVIGLWILLLGFLIGIFIWG